MKLKYGYLFELLTVEDVCPPKDMQQINTTAYRWVYEPIGHSLNFLPNYEFDKEKGNLKNYNNGVYDSLRKCSRCSQSMFQSLNAAKIAYTKLSKSIKEHLGYTHVATGKISHEDGFCTKPNHQEHFSFYELETCELKNKFSICDSIN